MDSNNNTEKKSVGRQTDAARIKQLSEENEKLKAKIKQLEEQLAKPRTVYINKNKRRRMGFS
jgi:cell division protein FtsB